MEIKKINRTKVLLYVKEVWKLKNYIYSHFSKRPLEQVILLGCCFFIIFYNFGCVSYNFTEITPPVELVVLARVSTVLLVGLLWSLKDYLVLDKIPEPSSDVVNMDILGISFATVIKIGKIVICGRGVAAVAGVAVLVNISTKLVIAEVKLHMSEAKLNATEAKLNATEANFNKYKIESEANFNKHKMESDARLKLAEAEIKKISSQVKEQSK
jgi:hypothetical protein